MALGIVGFQKKNGAILSTICLIVVFFIFIFVLSHQSQYFSLQGQLKNFIEKKKVMPIPNWDIEFQSCSKRKSGVVSCERIFFQEKSFQLHEKGKIKKIIKNLRKPPTHALLKRDFSPAELRWLAKREINYLVFPKFLHKGAKISLFNKVTQHRARYRSFFIKIDRTDLKKEPVAVLRVNIKDLPWFGTLFSTPLLVRDYMLDETVGLITRLKDSSFLSFQVDVIYPVFLSALAIILDQSMTFSLLSFYGVSRACRSLLAFLITQGEVEAHSWYITFLYQLTNGYVVIGMLAFVLILFGVKPKRKYYIAMGAFPIVTAFTITILGESSFVTYSLLSDSLATLTGIVAVIVLFIWKGRDWDLQMWIKVAVLSLGLFLFGYSNISSYLDEVRGIAHNPVDWRHSVHFPILVAVALLDVGSITRRMKVLAADVAKATALKQEVETAKNVMKHMLPHKKISRADWAARAFHFPASALAGDWFDYREVKNKVGEKLLLVAIVDITGHGVSSALVTSAISSQWNLWCKKVLESETSFEQHEQRNIYLSKICHNIHNVLQAMGKRDACTAGFLILDLQGYTASYVTAGHPGFILENLETHETWVLQTPHPSLGLPGATKLEWESLEFFWNKKYNVYMYTDGLIGQQVYMRWVSQLLRRKKKSKVSTAQIILEDVRSARRSYRKNKDIEDDITFILLLLRGSESEDRRQEKMS